MVTDSVALLMGSPESCKRHFGGEHADFANRRWRKCTVLRVEEKLLLSAD
jgi:hypothetical protein